MSVFKLIRISVLLSILLVVLVSTCMNERRLASWQQTLWVTIYPIVADAGGATQAYVSELDEASFDEINQFFERELQLYGVLLTPAVHFQIAPPSREFPPAIPDRHSPVAIAVWSLKMRWWSWRMKRKDGLSAPDIQMFVLYHALGSKSEMNMSVGMRKGMYGLVKGYTGKNMSSYNQIVIAHELLHILGASDKYVFSTGDPEYPFGYAAPRQRPLFPQTQAEIMGGRIPLSSFESELPDSLAQCRIGQKTAEEIGLFARLVVN
jgi:hypothetical protein